MEYFIEQFIELAKNWPFYSGLLFFILLELIVVGLFGQRQLFLNHHETILAIAPLIMRFIAIFINALIFIALSVFIAANSGTTMELDFSDLIAYITVGAGFCLYVYNSCKSILFNTSSDLQNKARILLFEYNSCCIFQNDKEQIAKWVVSVYTELKRFGLKYSLTAKHLSSLIYENKEQPYKNFARRLLCIRKKYKDISVEPSDIEMVISALLILAGDKKVDDFVPVSATIEATKVSKKKKILHVTKKRPCDASENTRCSDDG